MAAHLRSSCTPEKHGCTHEQPMLRESETRFCWRGIKLFAKARVLWLSRATPCRRFLHFTRVWAAFRAIITTTISNSTRTVNAAADDDAQHTNKLSLMSRVLCLPVLLYKSHQRLKFIVLLHTKTNPSSFLTHASREQLLGEEDL
jgi:hypothetical protein